MVLVSSSNGCVYERVIRIQVPVNISYQKKEYMVMLKYKNNKKLASFTFLLGANINVIAYMIISM